MKSISDDMDAAAAGDVNALTRLGYRYAAGDGVTKDIRTARYYLERAAAAGDSDAQFNLGLIFHNGEAGNHDLTRAMHWYEAAAKQNNADAFFNLAVIHETGETGSVNREKALECYEAAARLHHVGALFNLGNFWRATGAPDAFRAAHYYEEAAEQGHAAAAFNLGWMYEHGSGVDKDLDTARRWYSRAAELGDQEAALCVASILLEEDPAAGSALYEEAILWCRRAAEAGNRDAQFNLGLLLDQSPNDHLAEAIVWYSRAAAAGHDGAQVALAEICRDGAGDSIPDPNRAREMFEAAARQGNSDAAFGLGEMFANGLLGPADETEANRWFAVAASLGRGKRQE
jgi:TPR repeat protein